MNTFVKKFIGFSGVGAITTPISMLLVAFTNEILDWHEQISYIFAYIITLLLSYFLNNKFVFYATFSFLKLVCFCLTYLSGMLLGISLLWITQKIIPTLNTTLSIYLVIPITIVWNFMFVNIILKERVK